MRNTRNTRNYPAFAYFACFAVYLCFSVEVTFFFESVWRPAPASVDALFRRSSRPASSRGASS